MVVDAEPLRCAAAVAARRGPRLPSLFSPRRMAIVGASDDTTKFGGIATANALSSRDLEVHLVNGRVSEVQGRPTLPDLSALEEPPDAVLAVVAAPVAVEVVRQAAAMGCGAAVVMAAGFRESGPEGAALEHELSEISRTTGIRVLGPNGIGLVNGADGRNLSVVEPTGAWNWDRSAHRRVALVSQSGSIGVGLLSRLQYGVRHFVSTGNETDVSTADVLAHLLHEDDPLAAIGIVAESLSQPERVVDLAELAKARGTRLVVMKMGSGAQSRELAGLHTGSMVGERMPMEAFCRQLDIAVTYSEDAFCAALTLLGTTGYLGGRRLGIYTSSGGATIMAAQRCAELDIDLPAPAPEVRQQVAEALGADPARVRNPFDTTGVHAFRAERFAAGLEAFARGGDFDVVLVPMGGAGGRVAVERVAALAPVIGRAAIPVVPVWQRAFLPDDEAFAAFAEAGMPSLDRMEDLLDGMALVATRLTDRGPADAVVAAASPTARVLRLSEAFARLSAAGVPVAPWWVVEEDADVDRLARDTRGPVAVKVGSAKVTHKLDRGLVRYPVEGADAIREACVALEANAADAGIDDREVIVQTAVAGGVEVFVALARDQEVGPYLLLGSGGVWAELMTDRAAVPVLGAPGTLAGRVRAALHGLQVGSLLAGYRGQLGGDVDAVVEAAVALASAFAGDPTVEAIEINPLIASADGAAVVDAVMVVSQEQEAAA